MKKVFYLILASLFVNCSSEDSSSQNGSNSYSNWTQYRGDVSKTGFSSSSAPSEQPTDINYNGDFLYLQAIDTPGSPIIFDGKLYIEVDSYLYAYNLETGDEIWNYFLGDNIMPPTINEGVLYFVLTNDDKVIALNADDGSERWVTNIDVGYSSPTYYNGLVFAGNAALNADSGEIIWQFDGSENASVNMVESIASSFSPAISNGMVYLQGYERLSNYQTNYYVFAVDFESGEEVWRHSVGAMVSTIAIKDNVMYFTDGYRYALNSITGEEIWKLQMSDGPGIESCPAVGYGKVFAIGYLGTLYAFDKNTGEQLWEFNAGGQNFVNISSPVVADNKVFIIGKNYLFAIDVNNGSELWRHDAYHGYGVSETEPVITGGKVIYNNGYELTILE